MLQWFLTAYKQSLDSLVCEMGFDSCLTSPCYYYFFLPLLQLKNNSSLINFKIEFLLQIQSQERQTLLSHKRFLFVCVFFLEKNI